MSARYEPLRLDVREAKRLAAAHGLADGATWSLVWLPVDDDGKPASSLAPPAVAALTFSSLARRQALEAPPGRGRVLAADRAADVHVPLLIGRAQGNLVVVDGCRGVVVVAEVAIAAADARLRLVVAIGLVIVAVDALRRVLDIAMRMLVIVVKILGLEPPAVSAVSATIGFIAVGWLAWRLRELARRDLLGAFVLEVSTGAQHDGSELLRMLALLLGAHAVVATLAFVSVFVMKLDQSGLAIASLRLLLEWSAVVVALVCARRARRDVAPTQPRLEATDAPLWATTATLALRSLALGSIALLAVDVASVSGLGEILAGWLGRSPALSAVEGTVLQLVAIPIAATSNLPARQRVPLVIALSTGLAMKLVAGGVGAFAFGAVGIFLGVMAAERDLRGAVVSGLRFGAYAAAGRVIGAAAGGLLIGLPGASLGEGFGEQIGGILAAAAIPEKTEPR
ncbi:MAG: hypothetical protein Q8O67_01755 [Deltaproteobacteria bacterium]|nr:hypothetical protein [Deltaproteobacteria bacterium]